MVEYKYERATFVQKEDTVLDNLGNTANKSITLSKTITLFDQR
jgi:hypothetical protein